MREGIEKLKKIYKKFDSVKISDRGMTWNTDLVETFELHNLLGTALTSIIGGEVRTESRGAHARDDCPDRLDDEWMKHTLAFFDVPTGDVKLDYRPVHSYTLTDEVEYIKPFKRVY